MSKNRISANYQMLRFYLPDYLPNLSEGKKETAEKIISTAKQEMFCQFAHIQLEIIPPSPTLTLVSSELLVSADNLVKLRLGNHISTIVNLSSNISF